MPAFLNSFNTAILWQPEQLIERMEAWFMPFDVERKKEYGIAVSEVVAIYQFLLDALQDQLNTLQATQHKYKEEQENFFATDDEQKYTLEQMQYFAERHPVKDAAILWYEYLLTIYKYPVVERKKRFDEQAVAACLKMFSLERIQRGFRYYTDNNPFEISPIWRISDEQIFIGFLQITHYSLYSTIISTIEKSTFKARYYNNRDRESEKKTSNRSQGVTVYFSIT